MKVSSPRICGIIMLMLIAFVAACSTTSSRIKKNQEYFDTLPVQTQADIREGNVKVGFSPEMVLIALGEPDRRYARTTEHGTSEVWAYKSKGPAVSFGFGVGGGSGRTGVGTGIGITTGGDQSDDKIRVVFEGGKVTVVER